MVRVSILSESVIAQCQCQHRFPFLHNHRFSIGHSQCISVGFFLRLSPGRQEPGLTVLTQTVALSLDVEGDGAVEQAVEDCRGHDLIWKDLAPRAPALVRRDDHRLLTVVTLGDDLEEKRRLRTLRNLETPGTISKRLAPQSRHHNLETPGTTNLETPGTTICNLETQSRNAHNLETPGTTISKRLAPQSRNAWHHNLETPGTTICTTISGTTISKRLAPQSRNAWHQQSGTTISKRLAPAIWAPAIWSGRRGPTCLDRQWQCDLPLYLSRSRFPARIGQG